MKVTKEHAIKIVELLSHGLVRGLGSQKPGQMCVEAAVCFALDLPHGDNPPCVGFQVRKFKIGLNDKPWSSNAMRALGMRELAVAQLGSNEIDQNEFRDLIWLKLGQQLSPLIFRHMAKIKGNDNEILLAHANKMEKVVTLKEAIKAQKELTKAYAYAYAYAYANAYAYDYGYDYGYGYGYGYDYGYGYGYGYDYGYGYGYGHDAWFTKVAKIGVEVLQQLNSPGCEWLDLCK
jgi:hypothetical protein